MNATSTRVLRFCEEYSARFGFAPTVREIQRGCALRSTSVVSYHLTKLRAAGVIDFVDGAARTIRILEGAA
jgi:SOS-response transcriptional repressor LexA